VTIRDKLDNELKHNQIVFSSVMEVEPVKETIFDDIPNGRKEKKMKKLGLIIISIAFLMTIPVPGSGAEAPIVLKMAHYHPLGGTIHEIMKAGADWIENRFPGRVKVTIYPAQTLVAAAASYESTVNGVCDIAQVIPGWTPGRFPKSEIIDITPNFHSGSEATLFYWDFVKKFLLDEWTAVKVIGFFVQPAQALHTKAPVRTLEDLNGKKIRMYGIGKDIMLALGGTPVTMPISEAYEAIRTGVCSGVMTPFSELESSRFIDVTFHHLDCDIISAPFFHIMNLKKYNSLPADIRKALDEELPTYWNREAAKIWDRRDEEGRELARKKPGHELIILSPAEKTKWRERAMTINNPWASALEAKGLPGKKLLEEKYRGIQKYIK
jgi:TRAP-type C4-dicarboxylate transport system substrate-binding protein